MQSLNASTRFKWIETFQYTQFSHITHQGLKKASLKKRPKLDFSEEILLRKYLKIKLKSLFNIITSARERLPRRSHFKFNSQRSKL